MFVRATLSSLLLSIPSFALASTSSEARSTLDQSLAASWRPAPAAEARGTHNKNLADGAHEQEYKSKAAKIKNDPDDSDVKKSRIHTYNPDNTTTVIRNWTHEPQVGMGVGVGLTSYPTLRLEAGWHAREGRGFLSGAFEASSFSKGHWLARAILLDTYAREVEARKVLLNWRSVGDVNFLFGIGYENQTLKLLTPVSSESKELKRVINAAQQSFLFNAGVGSTGNFGIIRLAMEWVGISLKNRVRDTVFTERSTDVTSDEVEKVKNDFLGESKTDYRFLNMSVFLDF